MNKPDGMARLTAGLTRLAQRELSPAARVVHVAPMADGHAGLTFGFSVTDSGRARLGDYVLKLAPSGVKREGNTDVYRQAPLLTALHQAGMPVPAVRWASPDEDLLGTPFIVMERLPGRVFVIWEPHASFGADPEVLATLWHQAAAALARIHQLDWRTALAGWESPRPLVQEAGRWGRVLRHAQDPAWLAVGLRVETALLSRVPPEAPVGLVHGDYQPGNVLYQNRQVTGVIDWELASIGAQGLDVGWLLMMADPTAWTDTWRPCGPPSTAALLDTYVKAGGPAVWYLGWFQAFAAYRMAAIACLNVKLHRTGRRPDPLWDRFAPAISCLFRWAEEKLALVPASSIKDRP